MGRQPKPTPLKILHGDRKDRINTAEPKPADQDFSKPPDYLGKIGVETWKRKMPDLRATGVMTHWDWEMFAEWCYAYERSVVAIEHVHEEGEVIVTAKGRVTNPWHRVWKDAVDTMLRIGARFGFTPSDRSQIKTLSSKKDDKGAERYFS